MRSVRASSLLWALLGISVALSITGVCIGSTGIENVITAWLDANASDHAMAQQIVREIRLPRSLGAWAAGALLGLAGALAQGLFRNPLADPYLLGSAAGASFGVAILLAGLGSGMAVGNMMNGGMPLSIFSGQLLLRLGLTGAAFVGAVLAVLLTLMLARGVSHTLRLLLAGVIVGVVLGAATSLTLLFSPDSMQAMQAFMLGTTGFVGWTSCTLMLSVWAMSLSAAWVMARVLDGLSLGESTAISLGLPLAPLRVALICVLSLATGTAVAQTGLIAFVGLAAPHLVRAMVKVSHRWQVVLASLMGAVLLSVADQLARWLIAPQELPVGVLTAVLGGGYLLWLMHHRNTSLKQQGGLL